MSNVLAECNYISFPRNTSQNQIIQNSIGLIGQNDDICIDLQTLYNTVINKDDDMGSTYKYTISSYSSDIQNSKRKKHNREHFINKNKNKIYNSKSYKFPFLSNNFLILVFFFLIILFIW
jgi:hypothetical protein